MSIFNVVLMWVPEGVYPTSGAPFEKSHAERLGFAAEPHASLRAAVDEALAQRADRKREMLLPYIKAHTGHGVALFNEQAIIALDSELGRGGDGGRDDR